MVRAGNPNAAARLLQVDHNTVRRRVNALESEMGARLFDTAEDRYALTDEGETLLTVAESIEGQAVHALSQIGGRDIAIGGTVRIGVPDGLGTLFVAPRLAKLRQMHPQLSIELVITSRHFDLSGREADMAIIVGQLYKKKITTRPLAKVVMRLYGSKEYLARSPKIEDVKDLANHDFVSGTDDFDFGPSLNRLLRGVEPPVSATISCSSIVAQLKATAAGGGLCCFAKFVALTEPDLVQVLPDQVKFTREITLAVRTDLSKLARVKVIVDFLVREFEAEEQIFN